MYMQPIDEVLIALLRFIFSYVLVMKRFVKYPPAARSHSHPPAHVAEVRIFIRTDHVSRVKPVPQIIIESGGLVAFLE